MTKITNNNICTECTNDYEKELKRVLVKYITSNEFITTIEYLRNDWRNVRNELVHGLCTKKIDIVSSTIKEYVDKGYECFLVLNKTINVIKNNHIRTKFKIQ